MFTRHFFSLASLTFGMLGSLYLSYDLLGKPGGILRRLIFAITCAVLGALISELFLLPVNGFRDIYISGSISAVIFGVYGLIFFPGEQVLKNPVGNGKQVFFAIFNYNVLIRLAIVTLSVIIFFSVFLSVINIGYTHNFSWSLIIFIFLSMLFLLAVFILVAFLYLWIMALSATLAVGISEKRLGAIGAFMTLIAFFIQFILEVTS